MRIGNIAFDEYPVILAPMEDITDTAFRFFCKKAGADLMYTEFISSEGLIRMAGKSMDKLRLSDDERPIGVQVFGHNVESMKGAVEVAERFYPDLIDINYGCPVRKIVNKGAGASLLRDIPLMIRMTESVVRATSIPVTAKTRLGWDEQSKVIVEVAERLQDAGIQALTIHGRTRAQQYAGLADWSLIGEVKNNPRMNIPIIGNGDIDSALKAGEMRDKYGVDGIMVGRACVGYPHLFREIKHYFRTGSLLPMLTLEERLEQCLAHLEKLVEIKGERAGVLNMRKHYSGYFRGVPHFKPYRLQLLTLTTLQEIKETLHQIRDTHLSNT
ncbi:MAG: tRNA dihydrouridine synthase DusB [Bacteroidetes bacterium]|nr:tRNA dihydrouridine synthase DusB [Bacteroidota bacterium]